MLLIGVSPETWQAKGLRSALEAELVVCSDGDPRGDLVSAAS